MALLGTARAIFCAAACFDLPVVILCFRSEPGALSGGLSADSDGNYLLHYPAVTWLPSGHRDVPTGAVAKAAAVFAVAFLADRGAIVLLHSLPEVRRVVETERLLDGVCRLFQRVNARPSGRLQRRWPGCRSLR